MTTDASVITESYCSFKKEIFIVLNVGTYYLSQKIILRHLVNHKIKIYNAVRKK
uniref:Uncharacterized protein n=1 Tax=Octopus bimaculoides TaxID=37653 RepID=A0A0L8I7Y1_OCTBM